MHQILGITLLLMTAVLITLLLNFKRAISKWPLLVLFVLIGVADNLFYLITSNFPSLQIIQTNIWNNYLECNWSAKIYSIIFALIILYRSKALSRDDIGLHFRQHKGSFWLSMIFILFFIVTGIIVGFIGNKGDFDSKTLMYLAIMPGLNEELIYRGFLLGILDKIFDKKFSLFNTDFGWGAIVTSIVFGLLHGFELTEDFMIQINNPLNVILTGIFGFFFALMKERSGSLLTPIIGHSAIDFFHFLVRMM